ncbi:TIGR04338 family metallohydrolase [Mycolicibacterium iranicum]|uniref:TIGR04338 family metallohydrolase n=1 Tax=Mycolicibacterium iranicum TaxID=912594 RepID=A0ABT4HQL1_MYCIR|nr:TIGR04338 family metallohydrolase [Mycolicibacterium iranicum]MCZ0732537.1 TIGR04338 family metallohydrolase [Mycolicibacterium iranicum]
MTRDAQRAKVYAAEEFVRTMFDRAAERANPVVDFFGTQLTLPPEARFGSVDSVAAYVDDVLAHPAVRERWPAATPLRVRSRRGVTAAHYERAGAAATIAVPEGRSVWALRELVIFFGHFGSVYATPIRSWPPPRAVEVESREYW